MKNLYEKIDNLEEFTSVKESISKTEDPIITSIKLCYVNNESNWIDLLPSAIIGFNKFDNVGYFIADLEAFVLEEELSRLLTVFNEVKEIIVYFSDDTKKEYCIVWSSVFDKITDNMYIMLFETKNGEYYTENSNN